MSEGNSPKPLEELAARLKEARQKGVSGKGRPATDPLPASGLGLALRIGTEMVAAVVVGVGIGLLLDRWLDTTPWFLVAFLVLGMAAGILNVYRVASGMGLAGGNRPPEDGPGQSTNKTDGAPGSGAEDR